MPKCSNGEKLILGFSSHLMMLTYVQTEREENTSCVKQVYCNLVFRILHSNGPNINSMNTLILNGFFSSNRM